MKNKFYYVVLTAGLVLIVMGLVRKEKGGSGLDVELGNLDVQEQKQETANENTDTNVAENTGRDYLEGVLYKSEDSNLGNFKLSSNDGEIYIRTSRDFSALIGFQVLVRINGTKDNFELMDIESNVVKDGFIKQQ